MQRDDYRTAIKGAGLREKSVRDNVGYQFISDNAKARSRSGA